MFVFVFVTAICGNWNWKEKKWSATGSVIRIVLCTYVNVCMHAICSWNYWPVTVPVTSIRARAWREDRQRIQRTCRMRVQQPTIYAVLVELKCTRLVLGSSGGVVNSLDFYSALLKSRNRFHFWCVLFIKVEGSDSEFMKFTVPILKTFLKSECIWYCGNKQYLVAHVIGCWKTHFSMHLWSSGQLKNYAKTLLFHPPSSFPCNFCKCISRGICTALLNFHCYAQCGQMPKYSEINLKRQLQPSVTSCTKNYVGHSLVQTSFTELPNTGHTLSEYYTPYMKNQKKRK